MTDRPALPGEGIGAGQSLQRELLESWHRQTRILSNLCARIGETERHLKASEDGWSVEEHLCHIHEVRYGWLNEVSPAHVDGLGEVYRQEGDTWVPIGDLAETKRQLALSGEAVGAAVRYLLETDAARVGPYSHPVHFLQHMIWHEGYHFAVLMLALRLAGKEPDGGWEESNVWGVWRS